MAQAVTPDQIKFGYECFYRCDQCFRNVYENYQWLNLVQIADQSAQDDSNCPYCNAEINFDLSAIDKPSDWVPPILRFPGKDYSFVFKTDQSVLTTVTITIRGTAGKSLEINWGDKHKTITTFTGANQTITHNYTITDSYYISIFCEINVLLTFYLSSSNIIESMPTLNTQTKLRYVAFENNNFSSSIPSLNNSTAIYYYYARNSNLTGSIPSLSNIITLQRFYVTNNNLTGSIPSLSANINMKYLFLGGNQLTGSIPSLTSLTKIIFLYFYTNQLTGSIPSLSALTNLQRLWGFSNQLTGSTPSLTNNTKLNHFYFDNNQISNYTASTLALTLNYFRGNNNLLPSAAVNQILADFVTNLASRPAVGNIRLHGTGNQPPTGQGIIDKAAIIAHGWTVLTN